ncbi:hypothetical protein CKK33_03265 [Mucilaginibacter sp. MD40]|uniref:S41 family peptidase n=1 Tax=Mucilaginibacter sp. MD40 TaxID=2029590 RepID=UPI000BACEBA4|nr:S41 family peptidase [Mucilaginibacter sp. MD40]PAW92566.1 hypothetical protein CKK33_03265 [Mucilaginibacter sp. MD40]
MKIAKPYLLLFILLATHVSLKAQTEQLKNFDAFYRVFADRYAFFDIHHVNWKASYIKNRPAVEKGMTNDSLFSVMSRMLKPLADSHVSLTDAKNKRKFNAAGPSQFATEFYNDSIRTVFWKMVDASLKAKGFDEVKGYGSVFKGKHLFYFTRRADIGYLRFSRCFARITDGELDEKNFETAVLDSLMAQCKDLKAMIVDVRANIGGDDKFSYEVAGRFTAKPVVGHYKQERIAKTNRYTRLQKWMIKPKGNYAFEKPVIVLTNDKTVSAAEIFTLAMKQLPQVKTVGSHTEGNLSDMYSAELPNGWELTLSNQRYYSPKMIGYEGIGIPVDVQVLNSRSNLLTGTDPVVDAALAALKQSMK